MVYSQKKENQEGPEDQALRKGITSMPVLRAVVNAERHNQE
jgi:hypothetical protein|tara:strand:+ start:2791 stop:2913 length:123 start_codon:yes stop_codon:yes gene_type:complete